MEGRREMSQDEWDSLPPKVTYTSRKLKRNQIPDLRVFKRRIKKEGWLSNKQFRTRSGAERLIDKLEKEANRPHVTYSVYEYDQPTAHGMQFCVLALPIVDDEVVDHEVDKS